MKTYKIPHTDLNVSRLAYGCAILNGSLQGDIPLSSDAVAHAGRVIHTAYDQGITLFDHADGYGGGNSEAAFGEVLKQSRGLRDKITIQSKCGFCPPEGGGFGCANFTSQHIVGAVEGSLRRLNTDHLDILLLHSPDALMEPSEVAQAFDSLHSTGKVRYFGVSNFAPFQIELLKKSLNQPLIVNQIYLSLAHAHLFADGTEHTIEFTQRMSDLDTGKVSLESLVQELAKLSFAYGGITGSGTLDYCHLHDIQIQAYSPLRSQLFNPAPNASPESLELAQLLADLAKEKGVTPTAIALAWLLRHPAGIVPVIGSMNPDHIIENCAADNVALSRQEWYALLTHAADIKSRQLC